MVEIASPSTRAIDRSRELADYRLGGAAAHVLIDLPGLTKAVRPTADVHDFGLAENTATRLTGSISARVGDA